MAICIVPVEQNTPKIINTQRSEESDEFSPNKLHNCFVVHGRSERREKLNALELKLRAELEQLAIEKPRRLTIDEKLKNLSHQRD